MKFFNHDVLSRDDDKCFELIDIHGIGGYGFWWAILEELYKAENTGFQIEVTEVWVKRLARSLQITDLRTLTRYLDTFANLGLINKQMWQEHIIYSDGVMQRSDAYMQEKARKAKNKRDQREKDKQKQVLSPVTIKESTDVTGDNSKCHHVTASYPDPDPDPDPYSNSNIFFKEQNQEQKKSSQILVQIDPEINWDEIKKNVDCEFSENLQSSPELTKDDLLVKPVNPTPQSRDVTPLSRDVTRKCHADQDQDQDQDQEINIFNEKFQDADFQEISGTENQSIPEPLTQIINQEPVPVLALVKSRAKTRAKSKGDFTLEQFNEFWEIAEKPVGEEIAKKAFLKIKGVDFELLLEAWKSHHAHHFTKDGSFQYVKEPKNWLAEERWKDRLGDSLQGKNPTQVKIAVHMNNFEQRIQNRNQNRC